MLLGVDVSKWQRPDQIPDDADFVIARACYGTHQDSTAPAHAERARAIGATFGLYHFFRPDQDAIAQLEAFERSAKACRLSPGDSIPWVDIESYTTDRGATWHHPEQSWLEGAHRLVELMRHRWTDCGIYGSQRDWRLIGKPRWWSERPLWVAHYRTTHGDPATPGNAPWDIWQYRVGPWQPWSLHAIGEPGVPIDHNYARDIPLIDTTEPEHTPVRVRPQSHMSLRLDWRELRAARDAEYAERWGSGSAYDVQLDADDANVILHSRRPPDDR